MREFIFKFNTNLLPVNTRLSHYVHGISRHCNFCTLLNKIPNNDETFFHLFYECEHTSNLISRFLSELIPESNDLDNVYKNV